MKKYYVVVLMLVVQIYCIQTSNKNVAPKNIKNVTFDSIYKFLQNLKHRIIVPGLKGDTDDFIDEEDELKNNNNQQSLQNSAGGGAYAQSQLIDLESYKQRLLHLIKSNEINLFYMNENFLNTNEQLDKKYIRLAIILDTILSSYCVSHDCFDIDMYALTQYIVTLFQSGISETRFQEGTTMLHIAAYYLDIDLFYFIATLFIQYYGQDLFVYNLNKEINGFTVLDLATRSPYFGRCIDNKDEYRDFIAYLKNLGALHGALSQEQLNYPNSSIVSLSFIDMGL